MRTQPPAPRYLLGLGVHPLERPELLRLLTRWATEPSGRTRRMFYTNAHVFNLAYDDRELRALLNSADLLICEGIGGLLGGRLAGVRYPEQLATMDWVDEYLAALARSGASLFLLGDEPGIADRCATAMRRRHPDLNIVGSHHGFFLHDPELASSVADRIRSSRADVLLVGMGTPLQERWTQAHADALDLNLVLALGAMFRWYSGSERRAPRWMRRLGLEWLLRLLFHPVRHFRRYVIGNPLFLWRCLMQRLRSGGAGAPRQ